MNPLDELLVESKRIDAMLDHEREALQARAASRDAAQGMGLRGAVADWFVRMGLWLDPGADERRRLTAVRRAGGRS